MTLRFIDCSAALDTDEDACYGANFLRCKVVVSAACLLPLVTRASKRGCIPCPLDGRDLDLSFTGDDDDGDMISGFSEEWECWDGLS